MDEEFFNSIPNRTTKEESLSVDVIEAAIKSGFASGLGGIYAKRGEKLSLNLYIFCYKIIGKKNVFLV